MNKLFEISTENRNRGHRCKLNKRQTVTRNKRFFSAWVVNPWNKLDEETVAVGMVEKFKQLSEFGYWDMTVVLTQTGVF